MRESSGLHLDPLETLPNEIAWSRLQRAAMHSAHMRAFQRALLPSPVDAACRPSPAELRAAVLDDLATYFDLTPDECVERCVNWEIYSLQEWYARQRDSAEAITDFYDTVQSWSFDLLWFACLQATGHAYPVSTVLARSLPVQPGARHLDFGSGAGVTSQLFAALGYETALADISTPLLTFARYRLDRRGTPATYINLNHDALPAGRFDVITAIDTLVHVPDVAATARELHRALRPGGVLFANFDTRPQTYENAWHLYDDDRPLRFALHRAGFEPERNFDGMITRYRRVEPGTLTHSARGARDAVILRSPLRHWYRRARARLG